VKENDQSGAEDAGVQRAIERVKETGTLFFSRCTLIFIYYKMSNTCISSYHSEQKLAQEMGYNPYAPHLSGNSTAVRSQITNIKVGSIDVGATMVVDTNASSAVPSASPKSPGTNSKLISDRDVGLQTWLTADEVHAVSQADFIEAIDSSVAHILHCQEQLPLIESTIFLIYKILSKIILFPNDPKFSRIRTSNPQFQKKIANVEGRLFPAIY